MARPSFRPVLEGLEERAVPSVTPLHVSPPAAVHHDSQDKQPEMKIEFQQEKSGDLAHKGDDKAERQIEKTDSSRDKSLDDRGTQQSNDASSNDPSSTSVTDQVFSSLDSQSLKDL
jgi:hypothetical protein